MYQWIHISIKRQNLAIPFISSIKLENRIETFDCSLQTSLSPYFLFSLFSKEIPHMLMKLIENFQKTQLHDTVSRPRDTNIQRFFTENRLQIIGIQLFSTIQIWQFLSGKASNQNKDCIKHDILARAILLVNRHLRFWPHFTYSSYTS